ncbi:MAG: glycosyltransferase family 1 protein [Opitutaceae bacterium]
MATPNPSSEKSFPTNSPLIFLSAGHTAHARENTGIQRVTRSLARELQESGLQIELIEWVPSKRRFVILDDTARRNLARDGGPPFTPLNDLLNRVLPDLTGSVSGATFEGGRSSTAFPSLGDERIHQFEQIVQSIRHPIPAVPRLIDHLPIPRSGRRSLRRGLRRVINFAVQVRDRRRIRRYTRELVALRRLYDRMTRQIVRLTQLQKDRAFNLAAMERDAWRYKQTRDSLARAQDEAAGSPAPPQDPKESSMIPPGTGIHRPPANQGELYSLAMRLDSGRFNPPKGSWIVVPELMKPDEMKGVVRYCRRRHLKLAVIFHDAIAVTHPELVSESIRQGHADYMRHLCRADRILAVSRQSAEDLEAFARDRQIALPAISICANGASFQGKLDFQDPPPFPPIRAICVGTIDPRKNHRTLLSALERIHRDHPELDLRFTLIGNAYSGAEDLVELVHAATRRLPGLSWLQGVSDDALIEAYRSAHFTVFPSLLEGFGLPVLESIWHGRPCICSHTGATAEHATGGGCLPVDVTDPEALAGAIIRLAGDHALRQRLTEEAKSRLVRTWKDQAIDLVEHLQPERPTAQPEVAETDFQRP